MYDAENLSKLLGHLPPAIFRDFMVSEFELAMPDLDAKQAKRDQRAAMETVLMAVGVSKRQQIEEVAERIALLSDGPGQDVIEGFRDDKHSTIGGCCQLPRFLVQLTRTRKRHVASECRISSAGTPNGMAEMDAHAHAFNQIDMEVVFRPGLRLGQIVEAMDPSAATPYRGKITGIQISVTDTAIETHLTLEQPR